jgi:FAD/FMN-containing dehydrogenase
MVRTGAGRKLIDIDRATQPNGWELRMHPSTKRSATIGGFVAGGSGGVGSVAWGGLREPGNVGACRVVTMEAEPRVIELRESETAAVNHAYGTTGLITALEMPLAPAWDWVEMIVAFPAFMDAARFAYDVARADGIVKKLLTPIGWPTPDAFRPVRPFCPDGKAILIAMIADPSVPALKSLLRRHPAGEITLERPPADDYPLYEFTWNHTTLQVLKRDKAVTYLQTLHPADGFLDSVAEIEALFGEEVVPHLEFLRVGGRVTASGIPIVRYTTDERLFAIIEMHRARGVSIADPHQVTLEDGAGHKRIDTDQLAFKRSSDPAGLLNPGKMRSFG